MWISFTSTETCIAGCAEPETKAIITRLKERIRIFSHLFITSSDIYLSDPVLKLSAYEFLLEFYEKCMNNLNIKS